LTKASAFPTPLPFVATVAAGMRKVSRTELSAVLITTAEVVVTLMATSVRPSGAKPRPWVLIAR
jgi:hypothetical protein